MKVLTETSKQHNAIMTKHRVTILKCLMLYLHLEKQWFEPDMTKRIAIVCNDLVAFQMIAEKMGTRSATTHSEVQSWKRLWCINIAIKWQEDIVSLLSVCYKIAIEWGQICNLLVISKICKICCKRVAVYIRRSSH